MRLRFNNSLFLIQLIRDHFVFGLCAPIFFKLNNWIKFQHINDLFMLNTTYCYCELLGISFLSSLSCYPLSESSFSRLVIIHWVSLFHSSFKSNLLLSLSLIVCDGHSTIISKFFQVLYLMLKCHLPSLIVMTSLSTHGIDLTHLIRQHLPLQRETKFT